MLSNVHEVVEPAMADNWNFFLRGIYHSGLRLGEAINLKWYEGAVRLENSKKGFSLVFEADGQKNFEDQTTPCTPKMNKLLSSVPECDREGHVFKLGSTCRTKIGGMVSDIGEAALVSTADKKWATAHDLRRAFATYWSKRVMPATLMKMMRHKSISTTMAYYVNQEADSVYEAMEKAENGHSADTIAEKKIEQEVE